MAGVRRRDARASGAQTFGGRRMVMDTSEAEMWESEGPQGVTSGARSAASAAWPEEVAHDGAREARLLKGEDEDEVVEGTVAGTAEGAAQRSTCAAGDEEDADVSDASTTASVSAPASPRKRWVDLAASDDEDEEPEAASSGSSQPPALAWKAAPAAAGAAKARWADLSDDENEHVAVAPSPPAAGARGGSPSQPSQEAAASEAAKDEGSGRRQWDSSGSSSSSGHGKAGKAAPPRSAAGRSGADAAAAGARGRRGQWGASSWAGYGHAQQAGGDAGWQWPRGGARSGGGSRGAAWGQAGHYGRQAQQWQGKRQCQFLIGIEEEPQFQVKQKVLGRHGQNMKSIAEKTGAKLRLRGRGSGFLEGAEQVESSDPLMLCVSAPDTWSYQEAHRLVWELLESVHSSYRSFRERSGQPAAKLRIEVNEGPRPGSY